MNIAEVVLSNSVRKFDIKYSYIIPDHIKDDIKPGCMVKVPFGIKDTLKNGYVLNISDTISKGNFKLKEIKEVSGHGALLTRNIIELMEWMRRRYICTYGDVIRCAVPGVKELSPKGKTVKCAELAMPDNDIISEIEENRIRQIQQIRILKLLLELRTASSRELARMAGVSYSVIKTLEKNGYIKIAECEVIRDPYADKMPERTYAPVLTGEQQAVIDKINPVIGKHKYEDFLIHGITGSGKTEVYMSLISHAISINLESIVLVPEIALTPQMVNVFKGRFGESVAVIHSRLTPGERYDQWRLALEGRVKVVVGARSAVFAPFTNLGIIVIDEEHETSYKSDLTPKYNAIEVASMRCKIEGAVLITGSATPSVTSYYNASKIGKKILKMITRTNEMQLPDVITVDMREELKNGNRSMFSVKLYEEMKKAKSNGGQIILFLNRRGHSTFVLCRDCGYSLKCPSCSVSLTYHAEGDRVICHYCGFTVKRPTLCPKCKSTNIRHFGVGTQKIEDEVKKVFPGFSMIRMDMDTTIGKNSHEEILNSFREDKVDILIGTQMVAKGHDIPGVTLVGVMAADSMLNAGEFLASERTFQLITQVAGRAGRGEMPGTVVLQTYDVQNYSIVTAGNQDYDAFYKTEIEIRQRLKYPPFVHIAGIILSGRADRVVYDASVSVVSWLKNNKAGQVLGPARAPLAKIKSDYRWRIIIKNPDFEELLKICTKLTDNRDKIISNKGVNPSNKGVNLALDIDPLNML